MTRISVAQPVFATMVMLAITIFGFVSYQRLAIDQLPNVDVPVVAIVVSFPGASPEAVEEEIVDPLEEQMATIAGIDEIRSTSRTGAAQVILSFDLGVRSADAAQDVRDKLAQVEAAFPDGAEDARVLRFDPSSQPVMSLAVSAPGLSTRDLTALAEDVVARRLLAIQGVGSASVVGGTTRQVDILVDPNRMYAFGLGVEQITAALARENQDRPAGSLKSRTDVQTVTVEGRIRDAQDFLGITVGSQNGQPVRLRDVATVAQGESEPTSLALLDGERALAIDIIKQQGANTVEVAQEVRAAIAELLDGALPEGASIDVVRDNAVEVEDSFESVQSMLIEGAALATVIVFLFLNSWRSTLITGLTLPISVIGTMTVLWMLGFTLNIMTLLALSLAIGLLIDDAIVVRENIVRHLNMGKSHRRAALEGTDEIGLAVLATTFSIVAVFLPVAFMEGIIGRFFLQFGVTVSVAVLISLFVAFTLDPMMSSVWYDPAVDPRSRKGPIWRAVHQFDRAFEALARGYGRLVRIVLRHRYTTLLAAFLALGASLMLVPRIGVEFQPTVDTGEFRVRFETPAGSSLDYTAAKVRQVDAIITSFPEVERTYATINSGMNAGGSTRATVNVTLVPAEDRDRTPQQMTRAVREALRVVPGIDVNLGAANGFGAIASPLELTIGGDSFVALERLAEELMARLRAIDGITDVTSSLEDVQPTLAVRLDRAAAEDFGVNLETVAGTLSTLLGGQRVGDWTSPEGLSHEINVQLPEALRNDALALGALPIATGDGGGFIRLDQVVRLVPSTGATQISRSDGLRNITIDANISDRALGDVRAEVSRAVAAVDLPLGYRITEGGEGEQLEEGGQSAQTALVLAVVFIYLVLASQFGSFLQPLAIMMSLPFSISGVLIGLLVGGSTLNMFSVIGVVMLMGLVVKNAILLVDNANQRVRDGANLYDALVEAGQTRFRPIVMTTLAMIFGMLPLALNLHGGSGQNAPMAHAVIGGLISSTLLTLVVVPVALTFMDSLGRWASGLFPAPPDHGAPAE
nr:efflux RND transporter permease subunit [Rubellimicrobium arenae]